MSLEKTYCCGAYCAACKAHMKSCKGYKTGYGSDGRHIAKAKCAIKRCCMGRTLTSCADFNEAVSWVTLQAFYGHEGYKYGKYRQALDYIRAHGYDCFLEIADNWSSAFGRYKDEGKKSRYDV
jgi:hypothetical protein